MLSRDDSSLRGILMVAFHVPPYQGGSGIHRTWSLARHLPDLGWRPLLLTVRPSAYPRVSSRPVELPSECVVLERAFALDAARHLAVAGRHPARFARPDRWVSWIPHGFLKGIRMIRRYRPRLIWSTYPIPSAMLLAYLLHRRTGLPWVADLRDSMTEASYPTDPRKRASYLRLERKIVYHASAVVFTSPGTLEMYARRYPDVPRSRFHLVLNGYDEAAFAGLPSPDSVFPAGRREPVTLLHSGLVYRSERDPRHLFEALGRLAASRRLTPDELRIVFRACGDDAYFLGLAKQLGADAFLRFEPPLPYEDALREMLSADVLLLLQAANCNHQIPAKLYEYIRARRPILALTHPEGDTAAFMTRHGVGTVLPLDDAAALERGLPEFLRRLRTDPPAVLPLEACRAFSRERRAAEYRDLLRSVLEPHPASGSRKHRTQP